ncbi:hypothetical protein BsWGS_07982 [Bradybaena similaris]
MLTRGQCYLPPPPPPVHKHEPPLAKTHEYEVKGEYPHTSPGRSVRSVSERITTLKSRSCTFRKSKIQILVISLSTDSKTMCSGEVYHNKNT